MSVADNMAFSLKMSGVDKQARMERVKEASLLLGLEDYLDRKPKALSGGQRWDARSCVIPRSSAWTSRCRTSTRSFG